MKNQSVRNQLKTLWVWVQKEIARVTEWLKILHILETIKQKNLIFHHDDRISLRLTTSFTLNISVS